MPGIDVQGLKVRLAGRPILHGVDGHVPRAGVTAIIGPNGCGKSTLLRAMARLVRPEAGRITLDGRDLWDDLGPKTCARQIAFLPQNPVTPEGLRVRALIERGRTPYLGPFRPMTAIDRAAVDRAIELTGLSALEHRRVDRLSGGQRQRAWIALAIAQDTPALFLDEPTTFLDLPHQIDILRLVNRLNQENGQTIVMVLHDINQACRYADRIIAMREGRVLFSGPPSEVVTPEALNTLFGMRMRLVPDAVGGAPVIVPQ
ncbi:iron complex transport system ATP-binding protein [Roseovarius pacificus]|uniref:Iron complex transport system ATP-binding protein n=1 Tax=Roseovarius pacificus TaxID=337701 RepID=A0A1M7A5X3_9RHOB|nr:ABC transporter ATP-binding protein [Roseovarius pacificus]GGO53851.1 cobalamin/Fe3+-siderophore ABC transporter ATP-binding protein [Roseovarius pacificus]SHL38080.1 iron complex transport system ATP-binding protein [Roseovarius pacificus]